MSSAKWRPFCLGLNVLIDEYRDGVGDDLLSDENQGDTLKHGASLTNIHQLNQYKD